jgi:entericidin B
MITTEKTKLGRFALLLALTATFAFSFGACNTTEGVGEDVESAGEAIQDAADG